jgi:uncharacterized protein YndB with AHSA1/START domain
VVHLEREYDATAEQLWRAWTDPGRLARWLGSVSGPLLGADRPVRMAMGDEDDQWVDLQVLTADEPRLIELAWDFAGQVGSRLRVELVVVSPGRTRVVLDHVGLGDAATPYGAGWEAYLDGALPAELAGRVDPLSWADRFAAALPSWRERASASSPNR